MRVRTRNERGAARAHGAAGAGAASALAVALTLGAAAAARAGDAAEPRVVTTDGRAWAELVDAIEADPLTQGATYALRVEAGGDPAPCGSYTLALDDVAARAFRLGACDPATRETDLVVVDRAALFAPGDPVPRARPAGIHASIIQRSDALGGGGGPKAGAELYCTVALEPYLWDALVGRAVPLTPDRYEVTALDGDIDVVAAGDGWVARGQASASLSFTYAVSDIRTKVQVLTGEATLTCAQQPTGTATQAPAPPDAAPAPPPPPSEPAAAPAPGGTQRSAMVLSDVAMLTRNLDGVVFADGRAAASVVGHRVTTYGTAVGYSVRSGSTYLLVRTTLAWGDHVSAYAMAAGLGFTAGPGDGDGLGVYAVPAVRVTMLELGAAGESTVSVDAALLAGARLRLGRRLDLTVEAAAPIGGSGVWQLLGGVTIVDRRS